MIKVITFPVAPLNCNCSILYCSETLEGIVIDPGGQEEEIIQHLEQKKIKIRWIIHTHAHFDHCLGTLGVASFCQNSESTFLPRVALHQEDLFLYQMLAEQCAWYQIPPPKEKAEMNYFLSDEEELTFGKHRIKVLHTPGHTPGSCCFELEEKGVLFAGDTLFAGAIGRTDLPGGDSEAILTSIKNRIFTLDDSMQVIPGHGGFTQIYQEKKFNPFFN